MRTRSALGRATTVPALSQIPFETPRRADVVHQRGPLDEGRGSVVRAARAVAAAARRQRGRRPRE